MIRTSSSHHLPPKSAVSYLDCIVASSEIWSKPPEDKIDPIATHKKTTLPTGLFDEPIDWSIPVTTAIAPAWGVETWLILVSAKPPNIQYCKPYVRIAPAQLPNKGSQPNRQEQPFMPKEIHPQINLFPAAISRSLGTAIILLGSNLHVPEG